MHTSEVCPCCFLTSQLVMDNTGDLNTIFCDDEELQTLLAGDNGELLASVMKTKELLCGKDWQSVAEQLQTAFNISDLPTQVELKEVNQ